MKGAISNYISVFILSKKGSFHLLRNWRIDRFGLHFRSKNRMKKNLNNSQLWKKRNAFSFGLKSKFKREIYNAVQSLNECSSCNK